ncbi:MAG: protein kinase [Muribaculaceae bacterium]|nr:protein kinase [Muribaculaceae bacterium]
MESRDEYINRVPLSMEDSDPDSSIHADEESARLDFAGIFSNKFSNISLIYSSSTGATEIHSATRYGKRFALKGLKKDHLDDPISNMSLAKEFEIGIALDHPNIRRTLGLENVDDLGKRIVLEYIDGIRLSEMISEKSISPQKANAIALQIADAVKYLHGKQIFHRDLKPDNILIAHQGGIVKIIDFNLSDRDDYVILKNPAGSKRYMAPELSDPDAMPTAEADIYSLGVILSDLAEASGNYGLSRAAARCIHPDPAKRSEGLDMIGTTYEEKSEKSSWGYRILSSKTLTYILSGICILLSVFITIHYLKF